MIHCVRLNILINLSAETEQHYMHTDQTQLNTSVNPNETPGLLLGLTWSLL